ncbi:MAG: 16S rRNA (uracil(1498)-N(3))-methyltransferase [Sphingobacteriales bacterium]|nr:MAG: 16S rRNA (uracil(1498)-N(3))-methyltransferase [Sphingobacteriales bacterium]TAF83136.1 MAG: 16S rRNA (uracil(1498)-N(3))-methyltransferase [Sphingobacteriales bacterium]
MHLFYTPDIVGQTYQLNEDESKHCIKVLRLKINDEVHLIDGKGGFYLAKITNNHPKRTTLNIIHHQKQYGQRNHYLHIAIAPTKNTERLEWFLEKATEIGIDEITPIICEHSERKEIKIERAIKIITSAVKQTLTAYHPILNQALTYTNFLHHASADAKFIAHCHNFDKQAIKTNFIPHQKYLILIGPEGDFSASEITAAQQNGFKPITLGNTRLRTETAALAACFEINYLNR